MPTTKCPINIDSIDKYCITSIKSTSTATASSACTIEATVGANAIIETTVCWLTRYTKWLPHSCHVRNSNAVHPSFAPVARKKTVWTELEEEGTGRIYYHSSASQSSQWHPPVWMDYMDTQVSRSFGVRERDASIVQLLCYPQVNLPLLSNEDPV